LPLPYFLHDLPDDALVVVLALIARFMDD